MSAVEKTAASAILALIEENPEKAISFITGHFVGIMVAYVEQNGGDSNKEIVMEGTGNPRTVTIHAKDKSNEQSNSNS